jgi:hypothetical protein
MPEFMPDLYAAQPAKFIAPPTQRLPQLLRQTLARESAASRTPAGMLALLVDAGLDRLPLPGRGATLQRWQCLAMVAAVDLSLAKLYEGHTDALAILAELNAAAPAGSIWGVWCAEPPDGKVAFQHDGSIRVLLSGRKMWCSGAATVSHALVSCWDDAGKPWLAAVALDQAGVRVTGDGWQAVGMAGSASVDVVFDEADATLVGDSGSYVHRAGFWHGGAGIAACWYGAAQAIGDYLHQAVRAAEARQGADPHRLAQLGMVDIALAGAAALLREAAAAIDANPANPADPAADPSADAGTLALRARLTVEAAAMLTLQHTTRALGAGPLCRDPHFARMAADLPVFLRQSHAERDLAALGRMLGERPESPWAL